MRQRRRMELREGKRVLIIASPRRLLSVYIARLERGSDVGIVDSQESNDEPYISEVDA